MPYDKYLDIYVGEIKMEARFVYIIMIKIKINLFLDF